MSGAISKDVLLDTGRSHTSGAPTPHLSDLQGKRLAWASEPERGARFSIGQVKELSGGGEITSRGTYEKKFTKFQPTHLLLLLTNHRPHADASDAPFWDRLRLITFNMRFVDNPTGPHDRSKDASLWGKLQEEASGILAWLVRGCLAWQKQGLFTPAPVLADVQEYRAGEDILQIFVNECCVIYPHATVQASRLYAEYCAWAKNGNLYIMDKNNFGKQLAKIFEKGRNTKGQIIYKGLGIIDPEDPNTFCDPLKTSSSPSQSASQASSRGNLVIQTEYPEVEKQESGLSIDLFSNSYQSSEKSIRGIQSSKSKHEIKQLIEPVERVLKTSSGSSVGLQEPFILETEENAVSEESTESSLPEKNEETMVPVETADRSLFARADQWVRQLKLTNRKYKGAFTFGEYLDNIQKILTVDTIEVSRLAWARSELQEIMTPRSL